MQTVIKRNAIIRGDLANVKIHSYCFIDEGTVIRPGFSLSDAHTCVQLSACDFLIDISVLVCRIKFHSMSVGKFTQIGKNCVIESAYIGSGVLIGDNCVLVGSSDYLSHSLTSSIAVSSISGTRLLLH
jgi:carbonic anhydrase/acetyltransferase-like protein (isoleucine patch superfamily)